MIKSKNFKKAAGFSLIELMIVVAVLSSLTVVITRLLSSMKFAFKRAELRESIIQDHLEFETLLMNRQACVNTFGPLGSIAAATPTAPINVPTLFDGTPPASGGPIARLTFPAAFPRPPAPAALLQYNARSAQIIRFDNVGNTFDVSFRYELANAELNPRNVYRVSRFLATFNAGNVVVDCNNARSQEFDLRYVNTTRNELYAGNLTLLGRVHVEQNPLDPANTGYVYARNFLASSDRTKKENISPVVNALDLVTQFRGVEFDWIQGKKHDWGVIAQEVQKVAPILVQDQGGEAGLTVNYNSLIALTMAGLNELRSENEKLAKKVSFLENKVENFKTSACRKKNNYRFCQELREKKK